MLQGLSALYVFSFKQTFKLVKNLPTYYAAVYNYIARGKLGEEICARLWQPILDIKSLDYQEFSKRKMKDLTEWAAENYLNFVESIWPCYCRTIRPEKVTLSEEFIHPIDSDFELPDCDEIDD
ncbi:hypothetical protein U1Q18_007261 [Sarracenia purpurea var. burkii]